MLAWLSADTHFCWAESQPGERCQGGLRPQPGQWAPCCCWSRLACGTRCSSGARSASPARSLCARQHPCVVPPPGSSWPAHLTTACRGWARWEDTASHSPWQSPVTRQAFVLPLLEERWALLLEMHAIFCSNSKPFLSGCLRKPDV